MPLSYPRKKRKLSDLTVDDTNLLLSALTIFQGTLENDELIPALEKLHGKLEVIPHTSFSKADPLNRSTYAKRKGKAELKDTFLSFNATAELVQLVRKHVSLTTEAGCLMLINMVLLRLASAIQSETAQLNILPEFPVPKTIVEEDSPDSNRSSFSGVLDYLLASVPPNYSRFLLQYPISTISDPKHRKFLTSTIIEAKKDNLHATVPQAAVAVASYCKQNGLSVMRGCITSGEEWLFFVYKASDDASGREIDLPSDPINLGTNLVGLPLILGLLRDLVDNALEYKQKYFSYE